MPIYLCEHITRMWHSEDKGGTEVEASNAVFDWMYRLLSFLMMWTIFVPMFLGCYLKMVAKVDLAMSM